MKLSTGKMTVCGPFQGRALGKAGRRVKSEDVKIFQVQRGSYRSAELVSSVSSAYGNEKALKETGGCLYSW